MTEGGIASWKLKEGDTFTAGDVLVEIETDKATIDVEAQDDGFLAKIIVSQDCERVWTAVGRERGRVQWHWRVTDHQSGAVPAQGTVDVQVDIQMEPKGDGSIAQVVIWEECNAVLLDVKD